MGRPGPDRWRGQISGLWKNADLGAGRRRARCCADAMLAVGCGRAAISRIHLLPVPVAGMLGPEPIWRTFAICCGRRRLRSDRWARRAFDHALTVAMISYRALTSHVSIVDSMGQVWRAWTAMRTLLVAGLDGRFVEYELTDFSFGAHRRGALPIVSSRKGPRFVDGKRRTCDEDGAPVLPWAARCSGSSVMSAGVAQSRIWLGMAFKQAGSGCIALTVSSYVLRKSTGVAKIDR